MKILRCVECDMQVSVAPATDRVWCIECMVAGHYNGNGSTGMPLTAPMSARTERHQARLI